jgi:hypothetical protein
MTTPILVLAGSAILLGAAVTGMLQGTEPIATWFYPMAWYPTLVSLDAVVRLRSGRWYMLHRPGLAAGALAWSIPFWLFFELANFRLANWYYIFLPRSPGARWAGVLLSFATVLPAILLSRRALEAAGAFRGVRWRARTIPESMPLLLQGGGVLFLTLALGWPRLFFPLLWGAVTLLADPWVYRRDRSRSLLGMLERGRPAPILQLLAGGLATGLLWELYNTRARAKWIYTVPGLDELKLFEMPLLGFLGFPLLALDGWAVWSALVVARLAVPDQGSGEPKGAPASRRRGRRVRWRAQRIWWGVAVAGCVGVALGMEQRTISSTAPTLGQVVGARAAPLHSAGYDVFTLADAVPADVAAVADVGHDTAAGWIERARLATLRGIGTTNAAALEAAGVRTVEDLAGADPAALSRALASDSGVNVPPARVRVWVRGASGSR